MAFEVVATIFDGTVRLLADLSVDRTRVFAFQCDNAYRQRAVLSLRDPTLTILKVDSQKIRTVTLRPDGILLDTPGFEWGLRRADPTD